MAFIKEAHQSAKETHQSDPPAFESGTPGLHMGNFRWVICGLLFLATMINYMDRQVIGLLKPQLSHDLGWTNTIYGNITAAFSLAYAFGYLFGGRLMDKVGVKRGLPLAAFVWSVFAAFHGLARSVTSFYIARAGLGLSEGGNFPAAIRTVGEWFPVRERALATGIFNSASNIGAIVCPLTIPLIALHFGWPAAFYATGALGFLWIALWAATYQAPETHPRLSSAERSYIEEERAPVTETAPVPWMSLLRRRATWGYMFANIFPTWVWWFYLFWVPDFLFKRFHLTQTEAGVRTSVVYLISVVGSIGAGWLAAKLLSRGWSLNAARKSSLLVCALCTLPVFSAALVTNSWAAVLVVGLAAAGHQGWSANLYTFVSDTNPKRAISSVVGLGGFASGLVSTFAQKQVGQILDTSHSYIPVFVTASTMYLLALLCLHLFVPRIEANA